jgi:hypothetical protein
MPKSSKQGERSRSRSRSRSGPKGHPDVIPPAYYPSKNVKKKPVTRQELYDRIYETVPVEQLIMAGFPAKNPMRKSKSVDSVWNDSYIHSYSSSKSKSASKKKSASKTKSKSASKKKSASKTKSKSIWDDSYNHSRSKSASKKKSASKSKSKTNLWRRK